MSFKRKKLKSIICILCVLTMVFASVQFGNNAIDAKADDVYTYEQLKGMFPDPYVFARVCDTLEISEGGTVTYERVKKVQTLYINGNTSEVLDLTGITVFENLLELYINYAQLNSDSLAKLDGLNITKLQLSDVTGIESFEGLGSLKELQTLYITCDDLKSLSGIERCPNLEGIRCEQIAGLSDISAVSSLKKLKIAYFYACEGIEDISALQELDALEIVDIYQTKVSDISALKDKTNLKSLNVGGTGVFNGGVNKYVSCDVLKSLTNLQYLYIRNADADDDVMDIICELTNLKTIDLLSNWVTDISKIGNLTNLISLDIGSNCIIDFSPLASLENLSGYEVSATGVKSQYRSVENTSYTFENIVVGMDGKPVVPEESEKFTYNASDNTITLKKEYLNEDEWDVRTTVNDSIHCYGNYVYYYVPMDYNGTKFTMRVVVTYTVEQDVEITKQPQGVECTEGEKAVFETEAELLVEESGEEITYQWYKDGNAIEGETNTQLVIEKTELDDAGKYSCIVRRGAIHKSTDEATLTVNKKIDVITITKQPISVECTEGDKVEFEITATSDDSEFSYQWYKDGEAIIGATSAKLVIDSVALEDAGKYTCEVKNATSSVVSNEAAFTVNKKEEPTTEEPTTEEPTTEEPTTEEPTTEEPTTEEPTTEEPTTEEPTTEEPTTEESTTEEPTTEEPTTEEPTTKEPTTEESTTEEPTTEEPTTEEPTIEESTTEEPTTKETTTEETTKVSIIDETTTKKVTEVQNTKPTTKQVETSVKETTKNETNSAAPKTGDNFDIVLILLGMSSVTAIVVLEKRKVRE